MNSNSMAPQLLPGAVDLLTQTERNGHCGLNFHRLVIQQSRFVLPLTHRVDRGLLQQWVAADDFDFSDRTIFADDRLENHNSRDARLSG